MHDNAPSHSLRLTQQKTVLDLALNFAFLFGLLALEAVLILRFAGYTHTLLGLAAIAFLLAFNFYRASVAAVQGMGELMKTSFDYHRGLVLQAFHLQTPEDLSEEQALWVQLAVFLRRGTAFDFPEAYRNPAKSDQRSDTEKKKDQEDCI
jgi:hypothetical protein